MCIALQAKRKLGFVLGTCTKESYDTELHEQWDICNAIVLSWIINTVLEDLLRGIVYASDSHTVWKDMKERFDKVNRMRIFQVHRQIATLSQGNSSLSIYFTKLKELWAKYDAMVPPPGCDCAKSKDYIEHFHQQDYYNFLMD